MYQTLLKKFKPDIEKIISHLKSVFLTLNIGRASTGIVEGIPVDYYGTKTPLNRMASISAPNPKVILIQPWDKNALSDIEIAIRNSELGLNPINDGRAIRLNLPPLTEERRRELTKIVHTRAEEAKIAIRNLRRELWDIIQDLEKKGQITEDDKFQAKDDLQVLIDQSENEIKSMSERKEKEIMTI